LPAAQFTAVGWQPDHDLTFDEWAEIGRGIARVGGAVNWWIGDWINYGEHKWGEKYTEALAVYGEQYEYMTLAQMTRVGRKVDFCLRRQNLSWSHHKEIANLEPATQVALLDLAEQNGLSVRDLRQAIRDYERNARLIEKGADLHTAELDTLPAGIYRVIYADPPWRYDNTGFDQSAAEHYPTMSTDELLDLPVGRLAAEPCAIYLWATVPLMPEAFQVMNAWGFEYRTHRIWVKNKAPSMGWWLRTNHEVLLVGTTNGNAHPSERVESVVAESVERHSQKPAVFREDIARCHDGPRVELFARDRAEGWDSWGNEV
jgi:N6-adenosine-specific RNA methylase IME4